MQKTDHLVRCLLTLMLCLLQLNCFFKGFYVKTFIVFLKPLENLQENLHTFVCNVNVFLHLG